MRISSLRAASILAAVLVLPFLAGCPSGDKPAAAQGLCTHEVAETYCPICHPEVRKDPNVLLCKEHYNIPEEICTACHPELKAKYRTCAHELPPALCEECRAKAASGEKKSP